MNTTLVHGLRILELLSNTGTGLGARGVARQMGLPVSSAYRLLRTLSEEGYVTQFEDNKRYRLTLKVWRVGSLATANLDAVKIAPPYLRELSDRINETVHLSVLREGQVLYLDKIDSRHPVRAYTEVGGFAPPYCVATGKALLATTDNGRRLLPTLKLVAYTSRTITDYDDLHKEIKRINALGYATNFGEWREGVCGIAAPVYGSSDAACALGISGPADRIPASKVEQYAAIIVQVANRMSSEMGGTPGLLSPLTATSGVAL